MPTPRDKIIAAKATIGKEAQRLFLAALKKAGRNGVMLEEWMKGLDKEDVPLGYTDVMVPILNLVDNGKVCKKMVKGKANTVYFLKGVADVKGGGYRSAKAYMKKTLTRHKG